MQQPIPISKPFFGDEELLAVQEPLLSGWLAQGARVAEFERRFADFTGARYAVATTSCTTALHLALAALKVGPGDEVIVPAFTWISTANVVEHLGATPIFCDIDLATFNIDVARAEQLITSRTVGIMPVHLFGLCADMDAVSRLAKEHGLWVVEDAACGFGSRHDGRHAGTFGEMGCFSFHPRKSITTGEGGMIVTNDEQLDALCRSLRDHGAVRNGTGPLLLPEFEYAGYNYRMTDLQGALGCAQMKRAPAILDGRLAAADRYDALLGDIPWLRRPSGAGHSYQSYVCLFAPEEPTLASADRLNAQRNSLMEQLSTEGIATRQGTHAPVLAAFYARKYGLQPEHYPKAVLADRLSLALPLYPQITPAEQRRVTRALQQLFRSDAAMRAA